MSDLYKTPEYIYDTAIVKNIRQLLFGFDTS